MRTKFDVGSKVWFLDVVKGEVRRLEVVSIVCTADKVLYELEERIFLPEGAVFSSKEQLKIFYRDEILHS